LLKKTKKDAEKLIIGGVVLGVGADVVGKVGGPTGGITAVSKFQPTYGALMGAGTALDMVRKLEGKKKKKRKR